MQPQNDYPPQQAPEPQPQMPQQPVAPPQPDFVQPPMQQPPHKKPVMLLIIIALVVLALAGVATYFLFFNKPANQTADSAAQQSAQAAESKAKDISTYAHATFTAPTDMSAYKSSEASDATQKAYVLLGTPTSTFCLISYGTKTAAVWPGANIDAIINNQLVTVRQAGATIDGPSAGSALAIKDAGGTSYTFPTLQYQISLSSIYETDHTSVIILSSGERVFITRTCATKGAPSAQTYMDTLDATAKKLTISAS
jgi:Tfp pilus assembly protein PilE